MMENLSANIDNQTERGQDVSPLIWYYLPTVVTVPTLGLPTNALVVRLLLGKPGICSTSEIFTLNLGLFDFLFSVMVVIEYIRLLFVRTLEAADFLAWGLNQAGGPLLLCMLSVDSYMAVCQPLVFLRLKDPKLRLSLCFMVVAVTVGSCLLVKIKSFFKWKVVMVLQSLVIVNISTCSILILKSLHQAGPSKKEVHPVKKRAFKIVLTAFVLMNVHYIPPVIEYVFRGYGPTALRPFSFFTCVATMALSMSCFIQPLSYLIRTKQLPGQKSLKLCC